MLPQGKKAQNKQLQKKGKARQPVFLMPVCEKDSLAACLFIRFSKISKQKRVRLCG